ncbi:hypothetical protein GJAV_G00024730 [Gymnothorax javanicus]|nr:hypothetical protein GJAV_G00024730 [Gymnothorax javanicus]
MLDIKIITDQIRSRFAGEGLKKSLPQSSGRFNQAEFKLVSVRPARLLLTFPVKSPISLFCSSWGSPMSSPIPTVMKPVIPPRPLPAALVRNPQLQPHLSSIRA